MPDLVKVPVSNLQNSAASGTSDSELSTNTSEQSELTADFANTESSNQQAKAQTPEEGEPFLTLTPMPALPALQIEIPEGEARGSFAISPEPNLAAQDLGPGIKPESVPSEIQPKASKNTALGTGTNTESGILQANKTAAGNVSGTTETEEDSPGMVVNTLTGSGEEAFEGITIIGRSKQERADPEFTILSPMENSGEGIDILGGKWESGDEPDFIPVTRKPRPVQTAYSLSIVSTENSGGGLPSYGVFQKDQIYTVYLDMRQNSLDQDPSWILEFGLLDEMENNPIISLDFENYTEGLILPFPSEKKRPAFPEALIQKYLGGMIVINGIINTEGRMEQFSIQDSPDNDLNRGLLETLSAWVFRPARLNREPVAVKVLIGIPLWLPDSDRPVDAQ